MESAKLVSIPLRNLHALSGVEGLPPIYPTRRANSFLPITEAKEKPSANVGGDLEVIDRAIRSEVFVQEVSILDTKINGYFLELCEKTDVDPNSEFGQGLRNYFTDTVKKIYNECEAIISVNTYKNENFRRAATLTFIREALERPSKKMSKSKMVFFRLNRAEIKLHMNLVLNDTLAKF